MKREELDNLIAESKRLHELATEGPWVSVGKFSQEIRKYWPEGEDDLGGITILATTIKDPMAPETQIPNAQYIAHSRTALPALVEEIERLRRCLDQAVMLSDLCLHYSAEVSSPDGIDGYFDGWNPHPDEYPDLYAELKARESE